MTLSFLVCQSYCKLTVTFFVYKSMYCGSLSYLCIDIFIIQCRLLSSVSVIRGPQTETNSHIILPAMEQRIKKELNAVSWNPFPVDYWLGKGRFSLFPYITFKLTKDVVGS